MKYAMLFLLCLSAAAVRAEDVVVWVPVSATPVRPASSSATLTPEGVYWTFNRPRASVTLTPQGETYITFRGTNSTVTLLPKGKVIVTVQGR